RRRQCRFHIPRCLRQRTGGRRRSEGPLPARRSRRQRCERAPRQRAAGSVGPNQKAASRTCSRSRLFDQPREGGTLKDARANELDAERGAYGLGTVHARVSRGGPSSVLGPPTSTRGTGPTKLGGAASQSVF